MTTVIYSHKYKEVAYDSRQTAGGLIISDHEEKMEVKNGVKFLLAGLKCDSDKIIESYFSSDRSIDERIVAEGMAIHNGKVFLLTSPGSELHVTHMECDFFVGSGGDYALASLDHGKKPKEAVRYAMTRDSCTGGKIRSIKL